MFCKPAVLSQLWRRRVPHDTTLYAFSFWSSSYTLMATVWRISPSQFIGFFLSGLRGCKDCTSLPYYDKRRLGLSLGIAPNRERILNTLEAGLGLFSKRQELKEDAADHPGKIWIWPLPGGYWDCNTELFLSAQN